MEAPLGPLHLLLLAVGPPGQAEMSVCGSQCSWCWAHPSPQISALSKALFPHIQTKSPDLCLWVLYHWDWLTAVLEDGRAPHLCAISTGSCFAIGKDW